jgi:hypothetical protein
MTIGTKLCERILFQNAGRKDTIAANAPNHSLLAGIPQELQFCPFEHHMLATLRRIGIAQLHGKLTHAAHILLPFFKGA